MPETRPRVALFVTCLVDLHRPSVGFAAIRLLEQAGCQVEVPRAQTCCGQPAYNSGDRATTRDLAGGHPRCVRRLRLRRGALRLLRRHAEAPPAAFVRRRPQPARPRRRAGGEDVRAGQLPDRCARLDTLPSALCRRRRHLSRQLLRPARTRHQAAAAHAAGGGRRASGRDDGARDLLRLRRHVLREIPGDLRCAWSSTRRATSPPPAPSTVLAGDLGCLLNIAGRLSREGQRCPCATSPRCWPAWTATCRRLAPPRGAGEERAVSPPRYCRTRRRPASAGTCRVRPPSRTVWAVFGATSQRSPGAKRWSARGARVSTSIGPSRHTKLSVMSE